MIKRPVIIATEMSGIYVMNVSIPFSYYIVYDISFFTCNM
jgi:hypothetical protein